MFLGMYDMYRSTVSGHCKCVVEKRRFTYVPGTSRGRRGMKQSRTQKWFVCLSTMVILVLCLALSLSGVLIGVPTAQAADTGTWTQLPLYGGSISVLAIDPKTPATLYAGTNSSGVFRSTDLSLIHISEPTRLGMISYAVFCLKKKKIKKNKKNHT